MNNNQFNVIAALLESIEGRLDRMIAKDLQPKDTVAGASLRLTPPTTPRSNVYYANGCDHYDIPVELPADGYVTVNGQETINNGKGMVRVWDKVERVIFPK